MVCGALGGGGVAAVGGAAGDPHFLQAHLKGVQNMEGGDSEKADVIFY